jgi:hypothetical protein
LAKEAKGRNHPPGQNPHHQRLAGMVGPNWV